MKTQRALILPVLLVTLVAGRSELQAQAQPGSVPAPIVQGTPPTGNPAAYASPRPASQVPLGVPSALNAPQGGPPGAAPWGGGYVAPTGYMYGPPPGDMGGAGMAPMGPNGPMMDPSMMNPAMMGAGPMGPGMDPAMMDGAMMAGPPPMAYGGYGGEMMGGAYGGDPYCDPNAMNGERGFDLLRWLLPYPGGGWCNPRWYDVYAEFMYLEREDVSRRVDLISEGPAGLGDPFIVLSTDDIDFDERPGFRFVGAIQIGASSAIEMNYFGTFNWAKSASVTNANDELFSAFSDFGTNPPPQAGPPIVLPGFSDTDNAEFASFEYSSTFDSIEMDFRRRWAAPNCRFQGSWLAGVRYFRLEEDFVHRIRVDVPDPNGGGAPNITGSLDYQVGTANSMTGFQLGGDAWVTLYPGIQLGSETKLGIYGNRADQHTIIEAGSLAGPIEEVDSDDDVAFLGEGSLIGTWRVSQHLTVRGGLTVLYVDGVALAPENFNSNPPFLAGDRDVFINDNGDVFYHGMTAGLEWMW